MARLLSVNGRIIQRGLDVLKSTGTIERKGGKRYGYLGSLRIVFVFPSYHSQKRRDVYFRWSNQYWSDNDIERLSRIKEYYN